MTGRLWPQAEINQIRAIISPTDPKRPVENLTMKARFSPPNELELAGSSSELAELKLQLEDESKSDFEVNLEAHDPEPYDQALRVLTVQISDGPTRIEVSRDQVSVSGSRANIGRFASFLVVRPDQHNHYEHYPGNEWVDEGSTPIVIACESK